MGKRRAKKLSVLFSLGIFVSLCITVLLAEVMITLLIHSGGWHAINRTSILVVIAVSSILVGSCISHAIGKRPLRAISAFSRASQEVAKGNFDVQLDEDIPSAELQEMTRNFNLMVRELAGIEVFRKDFVENVSHEFKTPLSAIEGYAALLQNPKLTAEKREEYTRKILYNTRRLSSLTGNILLLSRLDSQEIGLRKETFSLDEQLREVILSLEEQWTKKCQELEIDLDSADCLGNRDLLSHVWQNILQNAVKYAPEYGIIRVLLRRAPRGIQVQISDNGPGMSPQVQKRVFERFYQGDPSRASQGNGLGLALAQRIVVLHGGTISVDSQEGAGSTFSVFLPSGAEGGEPAG